MKRLLAFLFTNRWRGADVKAKRPLSKEEERLRKIDLTTSQLRSATSQLRSATSQLRSTLLQLQQANSQLQTVGNRPLRNGPATERIARMQRARAILASNPPKEMTRQEINEEISACRKLKRPATASANLPTATPDTNQP